MISNAPLQQYKKEESEKTVHSFDIDVILPVFQQHKRGPTYA